MERVDDNSVNQSVPAIIVQGGGFAPNDDRDIYKEVTKNAADEGYNVLKVSVIDKYLSFLDPEPGGFGVIFPEVMIARGKYHH